MAVIRIQHAGDRRSGGDKAFSGKWSVGVMFGCEKKLKKNIWIY